MMPGWAFGITDLLFRVTVGQFKVKQADVSNR